MSKACIIGYQRKTSIFLSYVGDLPSTTLYVFANLLASRSLGDLKYTLGRLVDNPIFGWNTLDFDWTMEYQPGEVVGWPCYPRHGENKYDLLLPGTPIKEKMSVVNCVKDSLYDHLWEDYRRDPDDFRVYPERGHDLLVEKEHPFTRVSSRLVEGLEHPSVCFLYSMENNSIHLQHPVITRTSSGESGYLQYNPSGVYLSLSQMNSKVIPMDVVKEALDRYGEYINQSSSRLARRSVPSFDNQNEALVNPNPVINLGNNTTREEATETLQRLYRGLSDLNGRVSVRAQDFLIYDDPIIERRTYDIDLSPYSSYLRSENDGQAEEDEEEN